MYAGRCRYEVTWADLSAQTSSRRLAQSKHRGDADIVTSRLTSLAEGSWEVWFLLVSCPLTSQTTNDVICDRWNEYFYIINLILVDKLIKIFAGILNKQRRYPKSLEEEQVPTYSLHQSRRP